MLGVAMVVVVEREVVVVAVVVGQMGCGWGRLPQRVTRRSRDSEVAKRSARLGPVLSEGGRPAGDVYSGAVPACLAPAASVRTAGPARHDATARI